MEDSYILVSDRKAGVLIYLIEVRVEGFSFLTLSMSPIQQDYTIRGLYDFKYVRLLAFPE